MVLAAQRLPAHLLAGRTVPDTAFPVALVSLTVPRLPTLCLAGEGFCTLDLFLARSAPALFHLHLQTRRAGTSVTALGTSVAATTKSLATSITTCRGRLCARKLNNRLATWAVSVERERAGWTRARRVANVVAVVEATGEQGSTWVATLELWRRAGPWLFGLLAFTALYRGALTWLTVSRVTCDWTEVSSTAKSPSTLLPARPCGCRTSPSDRERLATVASLLHCLRAGWAGPRVAEECTFMRAAGELPVASLPATVRGLPWIKGRVPLSATEAPVLLGNRIGWRLIPALWTAPAYLLLLLCPVWIILQLLLLLKDGVLGPPIDINHKSV